MRQEVACLFVGMGMALRTSSERPNVPERIQNPMWELKETQQRLDTYQLYHLK